MSKSADFERRVHETRAKVQTQRDQKKRDDRKARNDRIARNQDKVNKRRNRGY